MLLAGVVAAVVLAGAAVTVIVVRANRHSATTCALPAVASGPRVSAAQAPDGGQLRVVETGFSQLPTPNFILAPDVVIGAVVENTSTQVAYHTRVRFEMRDAAGKVVPDKAKKSVLVQEIPVILPGEQVPVGASAELVEDLDFTVNLPKVASVHVTPETTLWVIQPATEARFAAVNAAPTQVTPYDLNKTADQRSIKITWALTSDYCKPVTNIGAVLLYRSDAGTLLGGVGRARGANDPDQCQPGVSTWFTGVYGLPDGTDPARTQVYQYCDPGAPQNPAATVQP
ncbi:hypothetical protein [Luedemannella flava]|uniref:hypothetical protein n=1 Tax=Luedemannella flava TaxID=349316 RepID=UPI0031E1262C